MNISKLLTLFILFSFVSCTSSLKIDSRYCRSSGQWSDTFNDDEDYLTFKRAGFGDHYLSIVESLRKNEIDCKDIAGISVRVRQDWLDVVLSTIPGYSVYRVDIQTK